MREYFGNLILKLSEKILGRPACFIYMRPKSRYATYRPDGYRGNSPFFQAPVLKNFTYFFIVPNRYPYKGWKEHFLIIPRREIEMLSELHTDEQQELIQIMGEYESQGYVIMSQQFGVSKNGSIAHKHVHVLK